MVAFGSVRSCGVTTLALSLAATWPAERRVLLVEADPAGGTLAAGSVWAPEPSLVSLAAAARRGGDPSLVWDHCQQLPGEVAVLAGPPSAEHARTALTMLHPLLGRLGELDADVLVDCGRLDLGSPLGRLWERSDRAVLVVRPRLADLQALATWLENLSFNGDHLGLVTVGDGPFADTEIAEALGVAVLARVPWDPAAAEALVSVPASSRQLRLAPLARAARTFADQLARARTRTPPPNDAVTAEPTSGVSLAVRSRVWKAFRPQTKPAASNGRAPKDVSQ
jgi:MinD-like ATPase involved in chromosome partitioning or flagellar assembly